MAVMPSRLDRVSVGVGADGVVIPRASRDALLNRITHLESMWPVVAAFRAIGATRPVELTHSQKLGLLDMVDAWADDAGVDELPEGIWRVRVALSEDVAASG
jgi:hypothetical protein